ncbi:uncharacterized protein [Polyergus mexicanus]|uniref:uncharacterized protein n=1 Tax=Polyergus mexicanus TaxID=615972 RepID=UPI0038B490DC
MWKAVRRATPLGGARRSGQPASRKPSSRNIGQTPCRESRRNAAKTPRTKSASTLPTVAEIALRRKTRPTPLHLTAAKRKRIGARSPPALGARSPPSHGARSPPALGARSPPAFGVRPPPAAGGQPTHPLVTIDLTLGASPTSAGDEPPAPGAPLPGRKKTEARLLALFGASPPKSTTGQGTKRDRSITPDIGRPRSTTSPVPWYPPPLISPLRRTPLKESIATQTSPIIIDFLGRYRLLVDIKRTQLIDTVTSLTHKGRWFSASTPRQLSPKKLKFARDEFNTMMKQGICRPSSSSTLYGS